ncbi:serine/threonine protein kinase [Stratiformator vulcanicus]|uniref:Serine/threonine-protein kinase PrkC n=1 Tax=Stratiformator vulcanicus TaxID=2527980 RepID=A0A517R1Q4_9PLAN|nr:serine/threonine-protein kinase [Stratiformator vulcanicus]QDT37829.1 Serine/threonine-protein kinase PrkC [Stratiformator vulcanicus]
MSFLKRLFGKRPKRVNIKRRFDLIGPIGQGSMSKVWKAFDNEVGRQAALKILDREKTDRFEARFERREKPSEGEIAVSLSHPFVVRTYEHGLTKDGEAFLAMEYLEGTTLAARVGAESEPDPGERCRWFIELGRAIEYLHSCRYLHRDISPRNSFITVNGRIKLLDFGLTIPLQKEFCRPGNRTGTANYMAPELIRRQQTDERVDVFAYSVTCFELATGQRPWQPAKSLDAMMHHMNTPPKSMVELAPKFGTEVADVIMQGMATDRDRRWPSMTRMLTALDQARPKESSPPTACAGSK